MAGEMNYLRRVKPNRQSQVLDTLTQSLNPSSENH